MATTAPQADVIEWLACPQTYAHRPSSVEHLETHISHVFLAGDFVYKLKKPVKYDFLDFSTLPNREFACREELRLNRRLAGNIYLRVVPVVCGGEGKLQIGAGDPISDRSRIVDWLVEMRRLPTELTLDALHRRGELRREHIARLAGVLVQFYARLAPLSLLPEEYRERYRKHAQANSRELSLGKHRLPRSAIQRTHGFQLQLLQLRPELLEERVRDGRLVDGHGDLRPEHICMTDPIAIFDCIEFNAEFRQIDVADELAFLAEECDCLGARWVGPELMAAYQRASGDRPPPVLFDFYKAYRGCVRAKVAALRAEQLDGPPGREAAAEARRHLALADEYAEPWLRPLALVVGGLSGTGKTTLARALAESLGAELLRTDVIRKQTFGAGSHTTEAGRGIYQPLARKQVYAEMMKHLISLNAEGVSVVLDGTFSSVANLQAAQAAIQYPASILLAIECVCRKETARARISARLADGTDASDARHEIHDVQRMSWEPWPQDVPQLRVDTEQPLETQVQQVMQKLSAMYRLEIFRPASDVS